MNRFENGFDSFKKAIRGLENRNVDEYALKDIIINFHHSIEVLFKHILYSKDKCLIYENIDNWINNCFEKKIKMNGDNVSNTDYTINFDSTLKRVIVIFEVSINIYTYEGFRQLCKLRNSLIHDEVKLNIDEVEQIFVSLITIVTDILRSYLPKDEKEIFSKYVDSEEYNEILKRLIKDNIRWRLITISNLLNLYMNKEFESLTQNEVTNILKTLSALGIHVCEEDGFFNIDDEYYISHISYLKQEICNLLLTLGKSKLNKEEILMIIKKNNVIQIIFEEYLKNAVFYIYELLGNVEESFFDDDTAISSFFEKKIFVNKHDIYVMLNCIYRIIEIYIVFTGEKRREDLLKRIYLDDKKTLSIQKFYSALFSWYSKNGWYNEVSLDKLENYEKRVFGKDPENLLAYDKLCEDIFDGIHMNELYQKVIGKWGEWGTIDGIDEVIVEDLATVVKDGDMYSVVFYVTLGTQTYCDHEYFDNGSTSCFIKVEGSIVNDEFLIEKFENLGYTVGFENLKFY